MATKDDEEEYRAGLRYYMSRLPSECVKELERIGFFDAPASKSHHLASRGGLARHSVNVTRWLVKLSESMGVAWPRPDSPYIVGMLHDVVKCFTYGFDQYGNVFYQRPAPYKGHGTASVIIATVDLGVQLRRAEVAAITYHMGAFNLTGEDLKEYDDALDLYPKEIIATHTADMLASRFDEVFASNEKENKQ